MTKHSGSSIELTRGGFIKYLSHRIDRISLSHPVRIAIDGPDCAGKTRLADDLALFIESTGRSVIRASIDGFHNPKAFRYKRGRLSPEGYFLDSFDLSRLVQGLLDPLGPGGSLKYRRRVFDYRSDSEVDLVLETADPSVVLVFDGVFLLRPELVHHWDLTVFLDTDFKVTISRMSERDGISSDVFDPLVNRYVEGQRLYYKTCEPQKNANILVDHNDIRKPKILRT
jgi:uridine kinase